MRNLKALRSGYGAVPVSVLEGCECPDGDPPFAAVEPVGTWQATGRRPRSHGAGRTVRLLRDFSHGQSDAAVAVADLDHLLEELTDIGDREERVGGERGDIRTRMFRHTYCATRLQTLDRGAPVSPWVVAREMGHSGQSQIDKTYGHLGEVRHRSEVVEYRAEQHSEALEGARLSL